MTANCSKKNTVFNLITAVVLVPFAGALVKLSMLLVKDDKPSEDKHPELHTLDEKLFNSPSVAVGVTVKAVSAMGSIAMGNFEKACKVLRKYDPVLVSQINEDEDYLDQFKDSADRFLVGLSKAVETEWDDRQLDMLIQTVPAFERVGDSPPIWWSWLTSFRQRIPPSPIWRNGKWISSALRSRKLFPLR